MLSRDGGGFGLLAGNAVFRRLWLARAVSFLGAGGLLAAAVTGLAVRRTLD